MAGSWTAEQVLAMAPDAGSARSATGLASPRQWLRLGRSAAAAWGECQGSARQPYQTEIDLGEPAFRCSCPSRKLPCKHGLGLLLLLLRQPDAFAEEAPPDRVTEWLTGRAERARRRTDRPAAPAAADPAARERRAARREGRVATGAAELDRWLRDLVGQGLGGAQGRPRSFWETPAARMVDAQAPGLARRIRELAATPATGQGWPGRLLEQLASLHLLLRALGRLDALPPEIQADVRALVGWTESQDDLREGPGQRDRWAVLGRRVEDDGRLRAQRSWLWGLGSGQAGLVLDFAAAGQPLDASLSPGTVFDGLLSFFPGAWPLRALVGERLGPPAPLAEPPGGVGVEEALGGYAEGLARNPWLAPAPFLLAAVVPLAGDGGWLVRDPDGDALPLAPSFDGGWRLCALSGGEPIGLFGEWDGDHLLPLGAWAEGELCPL